MLTMIGNFRQFSDFVLVGMIFLTQKLKLNPDNLATPLAASIGDVVSLIVLSTWATLLYAIHGKYKLVSKKKNVV